MLKVLWLTNHIMPNHANSLDMLPSPRGGWMPALAAALVEYGQVALGVAANIPSVGYQVNDIHGVRYYAVPSPKKAIGSGLMPDYVINAYKRVIENFCPDIIHIHGTEYFQGLLPACIHPACPTVISIQGILDVCQRHYWGGMSLVELLTSRTLRDWVRMDGLIEQKIRMAKRAVVERDIFSKNFAFIGRTSWDQAHTRRLNPNARYYHCDEMLRQPFFHIQWNISAMKRHCIFAPSASYPLKGFHVLIKAAAILHNEFPDITIRTPLANFFPLVTGIQRFWNNCRSGGYARYLTDLIRAEDLAKSVLPLPMLVASGMADELTKAHVFVLPSFIDNSPNSLAEAMLVGTPSVASFVGGVPSMVKDGESALCFSPGDETALAEQIRRIFLDDDLANRLSNRAREVARARHSKEKIVNAMLQIYKGESTAGVTKGLSNS